MEVSIHSYKLSMEETARYAKLADEAVSRSDVLVLNGYNAGLRAINKALQVKQGKLLGVEREPVTYYKGMVPFNTIVILTKSGLISMESLHWCKEQGISILLLDEVGNLVYSMFPEPESNAKLRRLQYQADDTGMAGYIARELIRMKTLGQINLLRGLPNHPVTPGQFLVMDGQRVLIKRKGELAYDGYIWDSHEKALPELSACRDLDSIRVVEAHLARSYWFYFTGIPLRWDGKSEKKVPPHWKCITDRIASTAGRRSPELAVNPFHAAINYLYGVAEHMLLRAIHSVGLDPACGFLHYDLKGRQSLVYDLIEPHRAEIDRLVLDFFARTKLRAGDVSLLPEGHIMLNMELLRYLIVSCMPDGKSFANTVTWLVEVLTRGS